MGWGDGCVVSLRSHTHPLSTHSCDRRYARTEVLHQRRHVLHVEDGADLVARVVVLVAGAAAQLAGEVVRLLLEPRGRALPAGDAGADEEVVLELQAHGGWLGAVCFGRGVGGWMMGVGSEV